MTDDQQTQTPNPGSPAAFAQGCTCPVLDNDHGHGHYGDPERFVMTDGCPVHCPMGAKPLELTISREWLEGLCGDGEGSENS